MTAGRTLAGYRLQERIAVGGMAEIYRATRAGPAGFAKQVVIKTVLPGLCEDPRFVGMFLEEARLAARLSSPNLVQVFDAGHEDGTYFLVMEHVDGLDLATLLARQGRLPPPLCIHLGRQLCVALADLHDATDDHGDPLGVVHRDVNPGNVLLSRKGDVKLGDFGIAKSVARGLRTDRGTVKGKLAYLSPEQARGEEVDGRADLYGLGLILFEALTGQRYLSAATEPELLRQAERPSLRAPSELVPGLPAVLDEVLGRALAPDPARRYPGARVLEGALARVAPGLEATAAREELAGLVREAIEGQGLPRPTAAERPAAPPSKEEQGPSTEVMEVPSRGRAPGARLLAVVVALGLLGALVAAAAVLLPASWTVQPTDASPGVVAPDARSPGPDTMHPDHRVDGDQRTGNRDAGGDVVSRTRRNRRSSSRDVRRRPDSRPGLPVDARPLDSAPQSVAARSRLAAIDRLLSRRGLLRADAPKIAARRRELGAAVARGEAVGDDLDRLEARIRSYAIDRAFVERKLRRLNREMAGRALGAQVKQRIQRHAQRALSHAVMGQYADANHELNQIARLLDR
jgi:hypothetical protein